MSILNFKDFSIILESHSIDNILLYYAFDWDDNILFMPTKIRMDKLVDGEWIPIDVSTSEFAELRNDRVNYRSRNNDPAQAYANFRDTGPRGGDIFIDDIELAIDNGGLGPAWSDFKECITNGALFAIITARGHESPTLRKGVEYIIDNVLSESELYLMYNNLMKFDYLFNKSVSVDRILKGTPSENLLVKSYLDRCEFVGVSAPSRNGTDSASNPEEAKEIVLMDFIKKVDRCAAELERNSNKKWKAMVGFSDDDVKNSKHIEDLIDSLDHETFQKISKIVVKGTKDPKNITKKSREFTK